MSKFKSVLSLLALALGAALVAPVSAHAKTIALPRALNGEQASSLRGLTSLDSERFYLLLPEATLILSEWRIRQEDPENSIQLSDPDRRTILEAAIAEEERNERAFMPDGTPSALQTQLLFFFSSATTYNDNAPYRLAKSIQSTLETEFKVEYRNSPDRRRWWRQWSSWQTFLWPRSPGFANGDPPKLVSGTESLVTYFELLRRLENKSDDAPGVWTPLLDAAYRLTEQKLLGLDKKLKILAQFDPESADEVSAIAVATLISSEDPKQEKICERLFQAIQDKAMLNVWADRYITRSVSYLISDIARPVRTWAFRTLLAGAVLVGLAAEIHNPQFTKDTHFAYAMTRGAEKAWIGLWALSLFKYLPLNSAEISDHILNALSRVLAIDNKGPLWNAQQFRRGAILVRCREALAKTRPSTAN